MSLQRRELLNKTPREQRYPVGAINRPPRERNQHLVELLNQYARGHNQHPVGYLNKPPGYITDCIGVGHVDDHTMTERSRGSLAAHFKAKNYRENYIFAYADVLAVQIKNQ